MGSCVSCPGRERLDEYVVFHRGTDDCTNESNNIQLYGRRNVGVLADINEFETVILTGIRRRTDIDKRNYIDSGYKSEFKQRLNISKTREIYKEILVEALTKKELENMDKNQNEETRTRKVSSEIKTGDSQVYSDRLSPEPEETIQRNYRYMQENIRASSSIHDVQDGILSPDNNSQDSQPTVSAQSFNTPGTEMCIVTEFESRRLRRMTVMTSGIDTMYEDYVDRLSPEHEKTIQRNYRFLLENLMAKCVTPRLVQDGFLSTDDDLEIRKGLSEEAQAALLIQKLVHSKPGSFATFLDVLRDTDQEFIALALEKDEKAEEEFLEVWTTGDEAKITGMMQQKESYLLNELDPDKILGFFVEQELFNIESIADTTFKSRRDKTQMVIDSVLQNLPYAFNLLLHALNQTGSEQLASRLGEWVSSTKDDSNLGNESSNWRHIGSLRCESKESKVRIQMKVTLCGGENEQPLLQLEACVLERINSEERENVQETFFKETESVFKNATTGSLTIHMTPCSKRTYAKLVDFCQHGSFGKLLKNLLCDYKTKQLLPQGPLTVKIQLLASGVLEESARSDVSKFRDRLIEEFDTVVDEINPMNFQRPFIDRQLLSEEYFYQLGQSVAQSRSARAADFVKKVLEIGEDAVLAFMETIEKKGPEYLLGVLKKDSKTEVDVHDNDELIAQLEVQQQESSDSNEISFYDTSFSIIIHDPVDSHGTQSRDSAISLNTTETEIYNVTDVINPILIGTTFVKFGTDEIRVDKSKALEPGITERDKHPRSSYTSDYYSQTQIPL